MRPEQLKDLAIETISENKGQDIMYFDISQRTIIADFMVIASGKSTRHIKSIAQYLVTSFENNGVATITVEGDSNSGWILVDTGDIIVHLMIPSTREFYSLEKIWDHDHYINIES